MKVVTNIGRYCIKKIPAQVRTNDDIPLSLNFMSYVGNIVFYRTGGIANILLLSFKTSSAKQCASIELLSCSIIPDSLSPHYQFF